MRRRWYPLLFFRSCLRLFTSVKSTVLIFSSKSLLCEGNELHVEQKQSVFIIFLRSESNIKKRSIADALNKTENKKENTLKF